MTAGLVLAHFRIGLERGFSVPGSNDGWGDSLLGDDREPRQGSSAKRGRDGDIRGIAAGRNQHPANSRRVVACVENPPLIVQISLEPRAEIHGRREGNADVAQVSSGISRRNVQCATESDGQMLIIAADADPVREYIERSAKGTRV